MTQKPIPGITWDSIVKMFLERIQIPSREEIEKMNGRLDRLEKKVFKRKSELKKLQTGESAKPGERKTRVASDVVLEVIAGHNNGADFKTIQAQTGFNDKKLRNIIFRLDKIGRIKRVKRGVYTKV